MAGISPFSLDTTGLLPATADACELLMAVLRQAEQAHNTSATGYTFNEVVEKIRHIQA